MTYDSKPRDDNGFETSIHSGILQAADNGFWKEREKTEASQNSDCQRKESWRLDDTMYLVTVSVFLYTLFYTPGQIAAFEWTDSLPDATQLEVCENSTANFPWGFRLAPGERVDTVSYHRQYGTPNNAIKSGQTDEMGTHIVSTDPHFTFTPDHQMIINGATANDTGIYIIKVMVVPPGETEAKPYLISASLLVKVSPVLEEGGPGLQAKLQPQAVMVTDGPQPGWHLELSCGTFLSRGQPAVTVTWTTPSGTVLPSTSYENGVFSLIIPNPMEVGDYNCQVDPGAPVLDCVSDTSPLRQQPAVRVDAMEIRVILLEARVTELTACDTALTPRVTELTARDTNLSARVTGLTARLEDLEASVPPLNTLTVDISQDVCRKPLEDCEVIQDAEGWITIQRRIDGSVDFFRGWQEYEDGFGDVRNEFWLGLKKIHRLTKCGKYKLRVDLRDFAEKTAYAEYRDFYIKGPEDFYRLSVTGYYGTAGDSLTRHSTWRFSTKDQDHDRMPENCAEHYRSAWWYDGCYASDLNSPYKNGVHWFGWKNDFVSLKHSTMKIKRTIGCSR